MAEDYVEKVAGELAELALADEKRSGDENIVAEISEIVGASSQTLQEAFLTAVRVRRAERRARHLLTERATALVLEGTQLLTDGRKPGAAAGDDAAEADKPANMRAELEALRSEFERPPGDDASG